MIYVNPNLDDEIARGRDVRILTTSGGHLPDELRGPFVETTSPFEVMWLLSQAKLHDTEGGDSTATVAIYQISADDLYHFSRTFPLLPSGPLYLALDGVHAATEGTMWDTATAAAGIRGMLMNDLIDWLVRTEAAEQSRNDKEPWRRPLDDAGLEPEPTEEAELDEEYLP